MSDPCDMKPVKPIIDKVGKYYMQIYGDPLPVCKGCFNVGESCGTPCTVCDRIDAWNKEFDSFLYLFEQFFIYKRINTSAVNRQ